MNTAPCCPDKEIIEQASTEITELDFLIDKETNSQIRMDICRSCPELKTVVNICNQCGCFMNIKTRIFKSACPLGKW